MILNKLKKAVYVFKQFWGILSRKFRVQFVFIFFIILIGSLLETLGVSVLLPLINAIIKPEKLMQNQYMKILIDLFHIQNTNSFVIMIAALVAVFYLFKNLYQILSQYLQSKFRVNLQEYISETILTAYLYRPYSFFLDTNSSVLMRNVINDANGIMTCVTSMFQIITTVFVITFMFIFLFITDAMLAGGLCLAALASLGGTVLLLGRPLRNAGESLRVTDAACYKTCTEAFQGIKEIIVGQKENFFSNEYKKAYDRKNGFDVKKCILEYVPSRVIEVVCLSALVMLVAFKVVTGRAVSDVMIANLGAFAVAAFKLLPAVSALSSNFNSFIVQYTALISVYTNLEESKHYFAKNGNEEISFDKQIKIENLAFAYSKNKDKKIFKDGNAQINKGDVIGIKGSSGAGKTTCVDILLGLLEPDSGKIIIDDKLLSDANINSWRKRISYVPQTAYLIDDTIRSNIAFGIPEKDIDDEKVKNAMKEAMLFDYVDSLPEKERTVVGERGVKMSGGQRQRLSIARALYTNPSLIIFDEATSALDETTEKEIMESIDNLIGQKTLIIIAHRLSTLDKCNKIFEVKDGGIIVTEK